MSQEQFERAKQVAESLAKLHKQATKKAFNFLAPVVVAGEFKKLPYKAW